MHQTAVVVVDPAVDVDVAAVVAIRAAAELGSGRVATVLVDVET